MFRSRLDRAFAHYARTGEPASLARVFDGCAGELYRIGYHLLGDRHHAEDLVQQTFVVAIEQAKDFAAERHVLPWLCGILTNRALHLRRQLRTRAATASTKIARDDIVDPESASAAAEMRQRVEATVRALPEPYRQVLLLHLVHELVPHEVAEALARPDATVRTQLARGLERLRKLLPIGFGATLVGQAPSTVGLATVRANILAIAAEVGPIALEAGTVIGLTWSGVVLMKKVLFVGFVLLAAWLGWWWLDASAALPVVVEPRAASARSYVQSPTSPTSSPSPSAAEDTPRSLVPSTLAPTAELDVVVLWHDGTPAADIAVRVRPKPLDHERWLRVARTEADGVAHFVDLPAGATHIMTARGADANADVDLVAGGKHRATTRLAAGIDVVGRVVDLEERPISGATVWLSVAPRSDDSEPVTTTGPDGSFKIRSTAKHFLVTATATGLGCAREGWVADKEIVIQMRPAPGVIVGVVEDANGRPVADARVLVGITLSEKGTHKRFFGPVSGQDLWPSRFLRTDATGRFRCAGLPPVTWPVWIGADGHAPSWREVAVRSDGETQLSIRLTQGASLRGRITDSSGAPVVGAEVTANPRLPQPDVAIGAGIVWAGSAPLWAQMSTSSDEDGDFTIERALVAHVDLQAWHRPHSVRGEGQLVDGGVFEWNAILQAPPSVPRLHGVLVDEDCKPLPNWRLRVGPPDNPHNPSEMEVEDDGSFTTNPVPSGRHRIVVRPDAPQLGAAVDLGEFDAADGPLRLVVPRARVPAARVRGLVAISGGSDLPNDLAVHVQSAAGGSVRVECERNGVFAAGPVQAGRYELAAYSEAFGQVALGAIDVTHGIDADAGTLRIPTPGKLVVRFFDEAGQRKPGVWCTLVPIPRDGRGCRLEHGDGSASGNVPAGQWLVSTTDLATMVANQVEVVAGATTELRLVVPEGIEFTLRLPANVNELDKARLLWRCEGVLVRDAGFRAIVAGKDNALRAPAGNYTLEVLDARGGKASTSFTLRDGAARTIVELPLLGR